MASMGAAVAETVCESTAALRFFASLQLTLLLALGFSFALVDPGTAAHAISVVSLFIVGGSLLAALGIRYYCSRRDAVNEDDQ